MSGVGKLALVTGASSGIGLELARCAAGDGCDLIVTADEPGIEAAATALRETGVRVEAIEADLTTAEGFEQVRDRLDIRDVDYFIANAGRGLGDAFLQQSWEEIEEVITLNVSSTTALVRHAVERMRARRSGRILITGSIAGLMPGSFQAVYNATKAYLDTLSWGIRDELRGSGVTVTCLMPGPTDTEFFARAHMDDTPVGRDPSKADPASVARVGYDAMLRGASGVTPGFMNRVQAALAGIVPDEVLARLHRAMAEPDQAR